VSEAKSRVAMLSRPRLCYLEIPAADVRESMNFYETVFDWNIRHRDTTHPSFDDATGDVSGAWATGREISRAPGLLAYIWVDTIDGTLAQIAAHGGAVIETPHLDSPGGCWIATFLDPAGNVFGLYQEGPR
jgi:predicted enzyme related to lactoylglutathione lyase